MNFTEYSEILTRFDSGTFPSLKDNYNEICDAQDKLILLMKDAGAELSGWKIVEDDGVVILSPIFDFQVFSSNQSEMRQEDISGIEIELCFPVYVPKLIEGEYNDSDLKRAFISLSPYAGIEILRPKINLKSHLACDFYFNYGIIVSDEEVGNDFTLRVGDETEKYACTLLNNDILDEKKSLLNAGVLESIRRGYVEKKYFFMTGSLNGLIDSSACLGKNDVVNGKRTLLEFGVK